MISLLIHDLGKDDVFYHVECEETATVEDLKCLISIQSNVGVEQQVLYFKQDIMRPDEKPINFFGIKDNDMINVGKSNLSAADQDLLAGFMSNMKQSKSQPRLT